MKKLEKKQFGIDEFGFSMLPVKFSNVKLSRIDNTDITGGCSFCFPHGMECSNSTQGNRQKNWKKYRRTQYRN